MLVVAVSVLAALTIAVMIDGGPLPGELGFVRSLQSLGTPVPELAEAVRATTSTEACLVVTIPMVWWIARHHGGRAAAMGLAIALLAMLAVQPISKEVVDRDRPTTAQVDVRADHTSRSFPSGHSLSTTATWGAASWYLVRRGRHRVAALAALPVALTGVSSSVQGVHWPSDAVAGTIIGALAAWWVVRVVGEPADRRD